MKNTKQKNLNEERIAQQFAFFDKIKRTTPDNVNPVHEIADLLQVTSDAVYRRMRGEKLLDFYEISLLAKRFNLTVDDIINEEQNKVSFNYLPLLSNIEGDYYHYINMLRNQLQNISNHTEKKVFFAATDIPIFHLCKFPLLKAFKIYTWRKQFRKNDESKFSYDEIINDTHIEVFNDISNLYNMTDSVEIWTRNTIDSYLKLVLYFYEIGGFHSVDDALMICQQLYDLLDVIKEFGKSGYKEFNGKRSAFQLFLSEIDLESNLIYAKTDAYDVAFVKIYSINTISTGHPVFCDGAEKWFNSVIEKSILISGFSQKQFLLFFKEAKEKIDDLIDKLTSLKK